MSIERSGSIMAAVEGLARAARRDGDDNREDRAYDKVMALVNDLAQQYAGAVGENKALRAALDADARVIADLRRQLTGSDAAVREYFASQRGQ